MIKKIYAVADYGTNSARLMIAITDGGKILSVEKTMETIRLGDGMEDRRITSAAMSRAKDTTLRFLSHAAARGAETYFGFATSAVRDADNKAEFVDFIAQECGIRLDVISGEAEARIGYLGASRGSIEPLGIIDIGGGSTEIITGLERKILYSHSFQTGTVRLLQQFPESDPDHLSAYAACKTEILTALSSLPEGLNTKKWLAIGGTATALAAIDLKLETYDPSRVDMHRLGKDQVSALCHAFCGMTAAQRKKTTGLQENRADVIVFGALLLDTIMERLGAIEVFVSEADNLEGYLLEKMAAV